MLIEVDSLDFDSLIIRDSNGNEQSFSVSQDLMIDEFNIMGEFMSQASKYAWWASLLEKVRAYEEAEQRKLELIGSQLNISIRTQQQQAGAKPTKDFIESLVYNEPSYQAQLVEVGKWSYRTKQLQYVVKAFEHRKDCMIQIGAELRKTNKSGGITSPLTH